MFLVMDGVVPRANVNGCRFRSVREAQDLVKKALLQGERKKYFFTRENNFHYYM